MRVGLFAARKPARGAYSVFPIVFGASGVARFLWWRYFVAIVVVSLAGCPVAGARVFLTD